MHTLRLVPALFPAALLLACAGTPRATLPMRDDFAGATCGWPRGEYPALDVACEAGSYRWTLKETGPFHVGRTLGLRSRAITFEVDATALSGKGTEPGQAAFGIGCLALHGSPLGTGYAHHGYVAMLRTDGGWGIIRYDFDTLAGNDLPFIPLAAANQPGAVPALQGTNRIAITCARQEKATLVRLTVNGRTVSSVEDPDGYDTFYGVYLWADTFPGQVAFARFQAREPDAASLAAEPVLASTGERERLLVPSR